MNDVTIRYSNSLTNRIGNDFWKNFTITIDWKYDRIFLSGLQHTTYTITPLNYQLDFEQDQIFIKSISNQMKNYNQEILGAPILAVNEKSVHPMNITSYCEFRNSEVLNVDSLK